MNANRPPGLSQRATLRDDARRRAARARRARRSSRRDRSGRRRSRGRIRSPCDERHRARRVIRSAWSGWRASASIAADASMPTSVADVAQRPEVPAGAAAEIEHVDRRGEATRRRRAATPRTARYGRDCRSSSSSCARYRRAYVGVVERAALRPHSRAVAVASREQLLRGDERTSACARGVIEEPQQHRLHRRRRLPSSAWRGRSRRRRGALRRTGDQLVERRAGNQAVAAELRVIARSAARADRPGDRLSCRRSTGAIARGRATSWPACAGPTAASTAGTTETIRGCSARRRRPPRARASTARCAAARRREIGVAEQSRADTRRPSRTRRSGSGAA